jgi:hypothetical protein
MELELDAKSDYVAKHRRRLRLEAARARGEAVANLSAAIDATESARTEVVACLEAEVWARHYPGPEADAGSLALQKVKGGRLISAIPEFRGGLVPGQLTSALREDAAWLDTVLEDEQQRRDEVDPHFAAIWETSPEGRKAISLANRWLAAGLKPRHVHRAGWGD